MERTRNNGIAEADQRNWQVVDWAQSDRIGAI